MTYTPATATEAGDGEQGKGKERRDHLLAASATAAPSESSNASGKPTTHVHERPACLLPARAAAQEEKKLPPIRAAPDSASRSRAVSSKPTEARSGQRAPPRRRRAFRLRATRSEPLNSAGLGIRITALALNPPVAPTRVLARQPQNQRTNVGAGCGCSLLHAVEEGSWGDFEGSGEPHDCVQTGSRPARATPLDHTQDRSPAARSVSPGASPSVRELYFRSPRVAVLLQWR